MTANGFTTFQLLAFAGLTFALVVTVVLTTRRSLSPRVGLSWAVLWIAAAIAIARPELTAILAKTLGIARGADLVVYFAILGMLYGFFSMYLRLRKIEREMTVIVREIAIRDAGEPQPRKAEPENALDSH